MNETSSTTHANPPAAVHGNQWFAAWSLAYREFRRFFRQRSRVVGALGMPVLFWIMLGAGMGNSFKPAGAADGDFLEYFFPGIIVLTVMFAAIYSTISIIQDRQEGFLQAVLVAPIPRSSLVLGKILGGTTIALLQGVILLPLAFVAGIHLTVFSFLLTVLWLTLISIELVGLGFILAWSMDSVRGFHAIMNLFLMPLWMLSGAFFPASGAQAMLRWVMLANPLRYGMAGVRHAMYAADSSALQGLPSQGLCFVVTVAFAVLTFTISSRMAAKPIH